MNDSADQDRGAHHLQCGLVLRVQEKACQVTSGGRLLSARYASMFPSPRTERVNPGNLVAMTRGNDGVEIVLWRWYDAVVLGDEKGGVRLWDPAHGEVVAQPRAAFRAVPLGSRAYLSAGLPGADWWVAGPVVGEAHDADVELDEVERLYTENGLWASLD